MSVLRKLDCAFVTLTNTAHLMPYAYRWLVAAEQHGRAALQDICFDILAHPEMRNWIQELQTRGSSDAQLLQLSKEGLLRLVKVMRAL